SIMVHHNLSLETLDCPCCPGSPHVAPGLGYRSCTLREGLVPRTLRPIVERRLHFKRRKRETTGKERERYDELGKAWKWVLVTSFGYQGYRNARFGRIECHEAINAYARE
ncbi:DNA polymerase 2 (DNA polymerase II), partial [mine drainage metagenome]